MTGRDTVDVEVYWITMEGSREVEHEEYVTLDVEYTYDEADPSVGVGSVIYLDKLTVLAWTCTMPFLVHDGILRDNEDRIRKALRELWKADAADHGRSVRS